MTKGRFTLAGLALGLALMASGCTNLYTKRITFEKHPIAVQVVNELIDEETLEYHVKFRNVGREVLSFDYTVADEAGVPHVDQAGPNSGLIENLYPGVEIEVPNPTEKMAVYVTIGTVTYGKKTSRELESIYKPDEVFGRQELEGDVLPNPLL